MRLMPIGTRRTPPVLLALAMMAGVALPAGSGRAAPTPTGSPMNFADPAFQSVWTRTDSLVASSQVKRSWYWGPQSNTGRVLEEYDEGPNGKHLVQYFDKSRMEINNPNGDRSNPFFVTNGLLTVELITGRMQVGDNSRVLRWPANIPLASDFDAVGAPTYASFRGAVARVDDNRVGSIVNAEIFSTGELDFVHGGPAYANFDRYNVKYAYYEPATKHNIPDVFWSFLNMNGPVVTNGKQVVDRLSKPYFYATGYPIADAYWTTTKIQGNLSTPVLIQPYQRRVLTYVPTAPAGWQVQMGNIGQHYYEWRYRDEGKPPVLTGQCPAGYPVLGFGKLYNEQPGVKFILGCQQSPESRATVASETFERGSMVGITRYDFYSGQNYEEVFALFGDGTAQAFTYFAPGTGITPVAQPLGVYTSTRNFANTWSNNVSVKSKLGNPAESAGVAVADTSGGGGGIVQWFDGGLMVYPDPSVRQILVLYNTTGYAYTNQGPHLRLTNVDRWSAYPDTYQP
jgi:hypothetical protein